MQTTITSVPGRPEKMNEDWAGATPRVAVVLDGLSSTPGTESPCRHGTPWFVDQLGAHLLVTASDPDVPLQSALANAISDVVALHPECDATAEGAPSATVAMIRVRPDAALDYLVLADARVVLQDKSGRIQVITDERVDEIAKDAQAAALGAPIGSVKQQRAVAELIAAQKPLRNHPDGYWVASGDPAAASHAFTGCTDQDRAIAMAALLSDGASRIVDVFEKLSWAEALQEMRESGPLSLIGKVRESEEADRQGHQWPRYKTSDDATIAFALLNVTH